MHRDVKMLAEVTQDVINQLLERVRVLEERVAFHEDVTLRMEKVIKRFTKLLEKAERGAREED